MHGLDGCQALLIKRLHSAFRHIVMNGAEQIALRIESRAGRLRKAVNDNRVLP